MNKSRVQLKGSGAVSRMYDLCNKKQYFTCGSCNQYNKFFDVIREGIHLEIIARILWVCSSDSFSYKDIYKDVYETLMIDKEGSDCE